jgi:DnaD/phage-associated family protein
MQKKTFTVRYGNGVVAFPEKAADMMISGKANAQDVRVLAALIKELSKGKCSKPDLCRTTSLSETEVDHALSFWRGAGILTVPEKEAAKPDPMPEIPNVNASSEEAREPEAAENVEIYEQISLDDGEELPNEPSPVPVPPEKKILISETRRNYTGIEIAEMLDSDSGRLRDMMDACQQILGRIFTPTDTQTVIGLCDWLGLEPDYVVTLVAYYAEKKPGCNARYVERAAVDLVNKGISTVDLLDAHIKSLELYDGISGKLRSLTGIGARAFTKKENGLIQHWVNDLHYGIEIITLAFEVCCDAKGTVSFDYMGKVLDNWFAAGVRTEDEAKAEIDRFRDANKKANGSSDLAKSFEAGEFFNSALKRSYDKMKNK